MKSTCRLAYTSFALRTSSHGTPGASRSLLCMTRGRTWPVGGWGSTNSRAELGLVKGDKPVAVPDAVLHGQSQQACLARLNQAAGLDIHEQRSPRRDRDTPPAVPVDKRQIAGGEFSQQNRRLGQIRHLDLYAQSPGSGLVSASP